MWHVVQMFTGHKCAAKQTAEIQRRADYRQNLQCLTHLTGKKF